MLRVGILAGTGVKERFFPLLLGAALCFLSGHTAFAQCTPDAYEEDDACIPSKTVIYGGDTQSHNFCDDATDWLKFNACAGRSYTIETSSLGLNTNTVLELYDTDCASLLTSDDDGGAGLASKIAGWTAPADGTYHIKVLQFDGTFGDDRDYDITLTGDTSPCSTWARTYAVDIGESLYDDVAYSVQQTSDGGFVVAGFVNSTVAGPYWVAKLDISGNVEWEKIYDALPDVIASGGASGALSVRQTSDGGFIVAGYKGWMEHYIWVLKLDAFGDIEWHNAFASGGWEKPRSIQQTSDDGYVIAGWAVLSFGFPFSAQYDALILKLDASGNLEWQKTYGQSIADPGCLCDCITCPNSEDYAYSVRQTSDDGYIVAGETEPLGGGPSDAWLLKLDASGNIQWQKTYGGASDDIAYSIQQTADGGYIVAGETESFGAGWYDFWVLKLDALGGVEWQKTYGGANYDVANSVQQTTDGGFIVAGQTNSFGAGLGDFWVLKLGASGNVEWQKTYGGSDYDGAYWGLSEDGRTSIQQTLDGGFVVAGVTTSFGPDIPWSNIWVLKLSPVGTIDNACTFINDTSVTGVNSSALPEDTNVTAEDGTLFSLTPTETSANTAATVDEQCLGTGFLHLEYNSRSLTDCGNANGIVDPEETITLNVTAENIGNAVFNVQGVLSTATPGIAITANTAAFPDIPPGLTGTSLTPFQFIVDPSVPCGTLIDFTLDLTYEDSLGAPFSNATPFQVPAGTQTPVMSTLFSEDFELCIVPPAGWTEIENGTATLGWEPRGPGCPLGCFSGYPMPTNFAINDSDCQGPGVTQDTELITPIIDTSSASAVTLQFDHDFLGYWDGMNDDFATVRVRSTKTGGAWVTLIQWDETQADSGTVILDATAECAGTVTCQFEWRYQGNWDWYWAVDNVEVKGEVPAWVCNPAACPCPALDPAVISDISPDPACDGDTVTFTAQTATGGVPPYTYRWDFTDDGTFDATAQTAANVYAAGGYTVRLRVEDSCGAGAQAQETTAPVTVNSPAPVITETCGSPNSTLDAGAGYAFLPVEHGCKVAGDLGAVRNGDGLHGDGAGRQRVPWNVGPVHGV
jgi:hypothetical protein